MSSTRLPGKVLTDLDGRPVLEWVTRAAQSITGIDEIVVATSSDKSDDQIEYWCKNNNINCYRGSLDDVLERFSGAAKKFNADIIMRITADCPFLDPAVCATILKLLQTTKCDYASNATIASWPDGLDCEVFTIDALLAADQNATGKLHREHVTGYIHQHRYLFNIETLICPIKNLSKERWTLDNPEDLELLQNIVKHIDCSKAPSYLEILAVLEKHPEFREINSRIKRNEGMLKIVPPANINNFKNSTDFLEKAEKFIPLGSQTFSKSRVQYPVGHAPLFVSHGQGGHVWDIDGNEYIDLVCGLMPIVLGYNDPDIDYAVRSQLNNGITFSLPSTLEEKLAKKLTEIIPSAEMVRFGKNGTDATSAAIRLARAYTGRDKIMVCGYHGWQDWYIGSTTRNKGVPKAVQDLTYKVPYNDLDAVEKLLKSDSFAALIMEPMNLTDPKPNYLQDLKTLLHKYGALLVFDETITGFRYSLGGAQELFGVTPDLSTFGKALANGMPLSAIVGRRDIMMEMENIFFSGTFAGETLSIAAAIALIDKMQREPVIETIWKTGKALREKTNEQINKNSLQNIISLNGKDPWVVISFNASDKIRVEAIKTMLLKEMFAHGVLTIGSHNICYSHTEDDIQKIANAYKVILPKIAAGITNGNLEENLGCNVIEPVFKVR